VPGRRCTTTLVQKVFTADAAELTWAQSLINICRHHDITSLVDLELGGCGHFAQMIAKEILNELRLIYFTPRTPARPGSSRPTTSASASIVATATSTSPRSRNAGCATCCGTT
jgi:hypothetical protein